MEVAAGTKSKSVGAEPQNATFADLDGIYACATILPTCAFAYHPLFHHWYSLSEEMYHHRRAVFMLEFLHDNTVRGL